MMYLGEVYESDAGLSIPRVGSGVTEAPGFVIDRPEGSGDYDFLHFTTPATMRLDGKLLQLEPGACILYSPECPQWYTGGKRSFTHDWFHIAGPDARTHVERFGPPVNRIFYPARSHYITDTVFLLYYEIVLKAECWEHAAEALVRNLLVVLRRATLKQGDAQSPTEQRLRQLRMAVHRHPEQHWRVADMAKTASLSRSRFTVLYKRYFGVSPMEEVLHLRLHRARWLLTNTTFSVDRVARESGFRDPAYFNRLFKKRTGVTPGKYR